MAVSKFLSHAFGKKGAGEKLVALRSPLTLKKSKRASDLQSNEPLPTFK